MESTVTNSADRWPTDIVEAREAAMLARLDKELDDLAPLRTHVTSARHPWWKIFVLIVVGGNLLVFVLSRTQPALTLFGIAIVIAGAIWAARRAWGFQKQLSARRADLDQALLRDVLLISFSDVSEDALSPYREAGMFGNYDNADLHAIHCDGQDMIHARLTRSETHIDSDGNTQTRTVTVFDGLLFELPFPAAEGDAVTVLRRGMSASPGGRFERLDSTGRRIKTDRIKTSSIDFNKQHKITTTDSVIAHAIFDPDRVMRFIQMEHDLADATRWGRQAYVIIMTQGKAWVGMKGLPCPRLQIFPEGDKLHQSLRDSFYPLSIPTVMAHHLRLPLTTASMDVPA